MKLVSRLLASAGALALAAHPALAVPQGASPSVQIGVPGGAAAYNDPRITGAVQPGAAVDTNTVGGLALSVFKSSRPPSTADQLAVCNGVADDSAKIRAAIAATPTGGTLAIQSGSGGCGVSQDGTNPWIFQITRSIKIEGYGFGSAIKPLPSVGPGVDLFDVAPTAGSLRFQLINLFLGDPNTGTRFGRHGVFINTNVAGANVAVSKIADNYIARSAKAWAANTAYVVNQQVYLGGAFYAATAAGTSAASGGPTGPGTSITDGSNGLTWSYLGTTGGFAVAAVNSAASNPNGGYYSSLITDNVLGGGVLLSNSGDSLRIVRNTIQGGNPGIYANLVTGAGTAGTLDIEDNNCSAAAGCVVIDQAISPLIKHNQLEQQETNTEPNNAMVDIRGGILSTTTTAASTTSTITVASANGVTAGQGVSGTGVPSSTTVLSVSGTSVTLSQAVNVASGAAITFTIPNTSTIDTAVIENNEINSNPNVGNPTLVHFGNTKVAVLKGNHFGTATGWVPVVIDPPSLNTLIGSDNYYAGATMITDASATTKYVGTCSSVLCLTTLPYEQDNILPALTLKNTAAGTDAKTWSSVVAADGTFILRTNNDANKNSNQVLTCTRSGLTPLVCTFLRETSFAAAEDHATAPVIAPTTCAFDATKQMLVVDATNGAQICSLPACNSTTGVTREVTLVKADTSANAVSFAPNGTDKITGVNANLSVGTSQGSAINLRCLPNVTGLPAGWWRH